MLLSTRSLSHSYTQTFPTNFLVDCHFLIDIFFNKIEWFWWDSRVLAILVNKVSWVDFRQSNRGNFRVYVRGILWIGILKVTIVTQFIRLYNYTLVKLGFISYYLRLVLVVEIVRMMRMLILLMISLSYKARKGSLRDVCLLHTWQMLWYLSWGCMLNKLITRRISGGYPAIFNLV